MFMIYGYLASRGDIYLFPHISCSTSDSGVQSALILHRILGPIKATAFIPEIEICNFKSCASPLLHLFFLLTPSPAKTQMGRIVLEIYIQIND